MSIHVFPRVALLRLLWNLDVEIEGIMFSGSRNNYLITDQSGFFQDIHNVSA